MKTFNRYLSSINNNIQVLDLPAADLDRILSKFFKLMSVKSMAKNMNLTRYQAFSEAYRGSFPMENLILTSSLTKNLRRRVKF